MQHAFRNDGRGAGVWNGAGEPSSPEQDLHPGSLQDGRYALTIFASEVSGTGGLLDGDCNGVAGDNFVLASAASPNPPTNIFRFFGDSDGDGDTDAANFLAFRNVFLGTVTYDNAFDFNNSGSVDAADFLQFRNRYLLGSI